MPDPDPENPPASTPPTGAQPTADGVAADAGEAALQEIIDQVPHLLFTRDLEGRFRMVNKALAEYLGTTPAELLGTQRPTTPGDTDAARRVLENDRKVIEQGHPEWSPLNFVRDHAGNDRVLQTIKIPYTISSTGEPAVFGLAVDVTDLAKTEKALKASEARLRTLFENSPVSLWEEDHSEVRRWFEARRSEGVVDLAAYYDEHPHAVRQCMALVRVLDVNRATLDLFQARSKIELLEGLEACFGESSQRVFRDMLILLSEGARHMSAEMEMLTLKGEVRHVGLIMRVAPGSELDLSRILFSITDMTEKKRSEEERRELEERIRHAQKLESLGILAGGVAHDFNNLLSVVLGFNELARRSIRDPERALSHLGEVERAAQRAASLADQMLAYSGRSVLLIRSVDLNELAEEIARLLEVSTSKKALLSMQLDPRLPAIAGDRSQLQQVLMNLITNASDAIGDDAGRIDVRTESVEVDRAYLVRCQVGAGLAPGSYARLVVTDTGCGMDAETQRQIFDPFFTTKFTGRGLGLAVTLGIVKGHNGAIHISSRPGKGTTFEVLLPLASGESVAPAAPVHATGERLELELGCVMIVDDGPDVRRMATECLRSYGVDAVCAANGREALELHEREAARIDAVLLDVTMPEMDGREAFTRLRARAPELPVVLSSGYEEHGDHGWLQDDAFATFLKKPYTPRQLAQALQRAAYPNK